MKFRVSVPAFFTTALLLLGNSLLLVTSAYTQNISISQQALVKDGPFSKLLRESAEVYQQIKVKSAPGLFAKAEGNAGCILIFPKVTTVALLAGGSHGNGVGSCRTENGLWSGPLFLNFNAGSFGVQVGADQARAVVFLTNPESQQQLIDGNLSFAPTSTFVAGEHSDGKSVIDGDNRHISIFTDRSGYFGGVALTGMHIAADDEKLKAFYSEPVTLKTIVRTYSVSNPSGDLTSWMKILPAQK